MIFRIFIAVVCVIACFFLYKIYGYRYVLEHIRSEASVGMMMGPERSLINIIVYVDYDSNWSRRAQPVLLQTLSRHSDVNMIIKPVAGVSHISELAARIALAGLQENKFVSLHNIFMEAPRLNESYIRQAVASRGMDYNILLNRAYEEPVSDMIADIKKETLLLGIKTTPYLYVENIALEGGGYGVKEMDKLIKDLKLGHR